MPTSHRRHDGGHAEAPCARLVLAAVDRAARHRADGVPSVPLWSILDHLAIRPRSSAARLARRRLEALERSGSLRAERRHGVRVWGLTAAGVARLGGDRRALGELPESPQHRAWRQARVAAAQELDRVAEDLGALLARACALLAADPSAAGSDAWLVLAEELRHACRRLGSAVHCLHEWPEPAEQGADVDLRAEPPHSRGLDARALARLPSLRASRRNVVLWRGGPFG